MSAKSAKSVYVLLPTHRKLIGFARATGIRKASIITLWAKAWECLSDEQRAGILVDMFGRDPRAEEAVAT
jgi:hypothetical protein